MKMGQVVVLDGKQYDLRKLISISTFPSKIISL
jgi:hypothetical protein